MEVSDDNPPAESSAIDHGEVFHPKGTFFIVALFALTLIVLWASVYVILLSRGVTV
jgi:hypothetical protein